MNNLLSRFAKAMIICLIFVAIMCVYIFEDDVANHRVIVETDSLSGQRVGVICGWESDYLLSSREDINLKRFDSSADLFMALNYSQVDAIAIDRSTKIICDNSIRGTKVVGEPLSSTDYTCYVAKNNTKLLNEVNDFIKYFRTSNKYDEFVKNYFDLDYIENGDYIDGTGDGDILVVGYTPDCYPQEYLTPDGQIRGNEIIFLYEFANYMNYQVVYYPITAETYEIDLANGNVDIEFIAATDMYRSETETPISKMSMSDGYVTSDIYCIVSDGKIIIDNGDAFELVTN